MPRRSLRQETDSEYLRLPVWEDDHLMGAKDFTYTWLELVDARADCFGVPSSGVAMADVRSKARIEKEPPCKGGRTLDLGLEGFAECPQVGPNACRYALPFGYSFLCSYPRRSQDSLRTEELLQGRKSS
jgi:hypothetical protein